MGLEEIHFFTRVWDDLLGWKEVLTFLKYKVCPRKRIRLTVCSNYSPAAEVILARFRDVGIEVIFKEWSEQSANALLDSAHLVLLPTNLSGFSLSKTHNRCSDALARNCLVLCSPRGPYKDIPGAVFSEIDPLVRMLDVSDKKKINDGRMSKFEATSKN